MILEPVDLRGRHEDSCGRTRQGRPRRRLSAEEAPPNRPKVREVPGAQINSQFNTASHTKQLSLIYVFAYKLLLIIKHCTHIKILAG